MRVLLLDNHDSFVFNLARYVRELGGQAEVVRSDAITAGAVLAAAPDRIIISPGPCTPAEAGVSSQVVREVGSAIPILGVCLGHQCIAAAFGGVVRGAAYPMHGMVAPVLHAGDGVLRGVPSPFLAARYHSLIVTDEHLPSVLAVTARSTEGEIMALRHREHAIFGVQFHPESVATEWGYTILANFLGVGDDVAARRWLRGDCGRSVAAAQGAGESAEWGERV